ncbi:MAG TPA: YbhB/YbcL family Raf kinase inhibitor-like protein [Casimicrobiaceae bacterium]|nr:YbhB/YbcL family Raf kinase inhibitor-like protein [Casimicrobiaceae bacterium]
MRTTMTPIATRLIVFTTALLFAGTVAAAGPFTVTSAEVKHKGTVPEEQVYNGFGCTGGNVSPSMTWHNVPAGTKSFAVTVFDPDAPTGSGWWHWVMFNIPASAGSLPKNAGDPASGKAPAGAVQSRNDFGKAGYGGPCPPAGDRPHRYIFTVFALKVDTLQGADENASPAMIGFMINANQVAKASIQATYGRK